MNTVIKPTKTKGRGVYAVSDIYKNETYTPPYIEINNKELQYFPILQSYAFCSEHKGKATIVISWASFMNHSKTPNMMFSFNDKQQIYFKAIRDIKAGEELTIDYLYDIYKNNVNGVDNWNKRTIM